MLQPEALFNESFYLAQNPDVAAAVASGVINSGFEHFIESGQFQVRQPSPLYDESYYLATNPDVVQAIANNIFTSGFQHFIQIGQFENRNPNFLFDTPYYLTENPDVADLVNQGIITGIEHFVNFGQFEDRSPTPLYNSNYYLSQNPDVAIAVAQDQLTGIQHYIELGAAQNRPFTPLIEPQGSTLPNQVATGDTTPGSTIFWTRSSVPGSLILEYATDLNFNNKQGIVNLNVTDITLPVQVEATNLTPNTQYFYRFINAVGESSIGSFRTPAEVGIQKGLRFGATADGQGELAPFLAIDNVPERNLDFFVELGNLISADTVSPDLPGVEQATNTQDFQIKYNEILSPRLGENPLADLRASTVLYSAWDDQNIISEFAGGEVPALSPQAFLFGTEGQLINQTPLFGVGLEAFKKYHPLKNEYYNNMGDVPSNSPQKLYRFQPFGNDAAAFVLDVRSFRDAPLPEIPEPATESQINQFLASSFNPTRTLLGQAQLQDLKTDLLNAETAGITWKFVFSPVPIQNLGLLNAQDRWEGYAAERANLLEFIEQNNIENVVFVSGDARGSIVNDLTYQTNFDQPQIQTDVIEITVGPVAVQLDLGQGEFAAPFGSTLVASSSIDRISPDTRDAYFNLDTTSQKDQFIQTIVNNQLIELGYDVIGLEETEFNAELIQGSYFAVHNFGWTEFFVNPQTQQLQVTVYGIEPYTETELETIPATILSRQPEVISQFVINPDLEIIE